MVVWVVGASDVVVVADVGHGAADDALVVAVVAAAAVDGDDVVVDDENGVDWVAVALALCVSLFAAPRPMVDV